MNINLPESYQKLDENERNLLHVLAIAAVEVNINSFNNALYTAGIRDGKNSFTARAATEVLDSLRLKKLVDKIGTQYLINADVVDSVTFAAYKANEYSRIYGACNQFFSQWMYFTGGNNSGWRIFMREMRLAVASSDVDRFSTAYNSMRQRYPDKVGELRPIDYFFFRPYRKDWFDSLSAGLQSLAITTVAKQRLYDLQPIEEIVLEFLPRGAKSEDSVLRSSCIALLGEYYFLRGDWERLKLFLKQHQDAPYSQALLAPLAVAQGNPQLAIEAFEDAQKHWKKQTSSKSGYANFAGLFYAIALLIVNTPESNRKAETYLDSFEKYNPALKNQMVLLYGLILLRQNKRLEANNIIAVSLNGLQNEQQKYFMILARHWINPEKISHTDVKALYLSTRNAGYNWLAYEYLSAFDAFKNGKSDYHEQLITLQTELGNATPLYGQIEQVETWQLALQALTSLVASPSASKRQIGEGRVVWQVDFKESEIQPKEQTLNKSGTWSSGRNIALNRLREGDVKNMSPQDHKIAKSIEQDRGSWNNSFSFNTERAFKEMVGHPYLFLLKSPQVSVSLTEEKPSIMVKEVDGNIEVKFSIDVERAGTQVFKETPTRYKLVNVTEEHLKIARALGGNSIKVPPKGKEALLNTITSLAPLIEVRSTVAGQATNAKIIDADERIYAHLLPVNEGFYLEFFVKPLRETGPYVKPGEGEETVFGSLENETLQSKRDLKKEKKSLQIIRGLLPAIEDIKPKSGVYEIADAEQCLNLLMQLEPLKKEDKLVLEWPRGERFRITHTADFKNLSIKVKRENDWFGVSGELRLDENNVLQMQELLEKMNASKNEFIELSDGKFLALTKEFRRRLREMESLMNASKGGALQIHPLAAGAMNDFGALLGSFDVDKKWQQNQKRLKDAFSKHYLLPEGFDATLRPYQMEGYQWLQRLSAWGVGACLADDMGLGKTVQALACILDRAHEGATLVVAPVSVCGNWVKEVARFTPKLNITFFGEGDRKETIEKAGAFDVIICTYGLLQREGEILTDKKFTTIVLDEAQAIKNKDTKRSEIAMKLKGDFKIITTGTPIENHLGEIWNLFNFINPGLLGSLERFNQKYALPIEKAKDADTRNALRRLLQPFILRRRKDEVLKDLPEKTEIVLNVEFSAAERAFYEALRRSAIDSLTKEIDDEKGAGAKHLRILAEIMKLRRACCNPKLVDPLIDLPSSKMAIFNEITDELIDNGHKALVFSQFTSHLALLRENLDKKGIKYQYLDGQTPQKKRQELIDKFQNGEGDLFLISLKAGGTGLNLTNADYVLHMDPWWNPAVEDQATDRAHRIGQQRPVTVYRFVASETIEDKILKLHEHKRDLADSLLSGTDISSKLSADELLNLLKG